ncbi:MAG: type II toxin-antitoxin system VapC family toxin [Chloroflexota bacterium]
MIIYADSSALAKLILDEPGSAEFEAFASSASGVISASIAYAEVRAAASAALRDRRIPIDARDQIMLNLELIWQHISPIEVTWPLVRQAGELAERHALRGFDAIHLAAFLSVFDQPDTVFACWDRRLSEAARRAGCLEVYPGSS